MIIVGNSISLGGGGSSGKLNIFSSLTEPETKNGIWIKSDQKITNIVQDNDVWTPNTFYYTGNINSANYGNFFANDAMENRIFYYNGYIYKFQSNACGNGLFKAPIDTAVFALVNANTAKPYYGVAQDLKNPRYLYGVVGSYTSSSTGVVHKYDLEDGSYTVMSGGINYYQWMQSYQSAIVYDDYFYSFYTNSSSSASGSTPTGILKKNLNDTGWAYEDILSMTSTSYPRMVLVGTNMYILSATSDYKLSVIKYNLETKASSTMSLSGDITLETNTSMYMVYATDNTNKIYIMCPNYGTYATKMFVLNVDTGVVSSYSASSGVMGMQGGYGAMLYHNGAVYVYNVYKSSDTDYAMYQFKLTGKSYPTGTLAIVRTSNNDGTYETELISPKDRPSGTYNMFNTGYNMVYQSIDEQLVMSHPVYNGNGTSWVQIR